MEPSSAVAACAVRGNFIYLYYRSGNRPSTKPLFVLSPQSPSSSSGSGTGSLTATSGITNPYATASLAQANSYGQGDTTTITATSKNDDEKTLAAVPDISPTAPSSGGDGALFIQIQNTSNSDPNLEDLGRQASSVSIATTFSFDGRTGTYRHGLLLAFQQLSARFPLLVQMTAQSPTPGSIQDTSFSDSPWTLNNFPQPTTMPFGIVKQFWLAASASPAPEGSSVYQLFATQGSPVLHLGGYNVAKQAVTNVNGMIPILADLNPTMIKLTGIAGFDAAIIGDSGTPIPSTGIQFVNSAGSLSFVVSAIAKDRYCF